VRAQPSLAWDLGETHGTVALRVPDHPTALALLRRTGPMAVSSANRTGSPAAVTAQDAFDQLGGSVDVYLDAGAAPGGVASTIVDATGDRLRLVRAGAVSLAQLREVTPVDGPDTDAPAADASPPASASSATAPGVTADGGPPVAAPEGSTA
jgi:L-threonylcarbamoyladenylate synthase